MKKSIGLRKRWLRNTVGTIAILGLVFALLATGVYGYTRYSNLRNDLRQRAVATTEYFVAHENQTYEEFHSACVSYVETFTDQDAVQLLLLDRSGTAEAASQMEWVGTSPNTSEISNVLDGSQSATFVGIDPVAGERVVALSSPVMYGGELIGIFRYVAATEQTDMRILFVCVLCIHCSIVLCVIKVILF